MLGTVTSKFHVARIMAKTGIASSAVRRPDRGVRAVGLLKEWGTNPAGAFAAAAVRDPSGIALIDEQGQLSYREIHLRSNSIAAGWRAQGLKAGDVIAIMARNHRGWVESSVAVAKLGAHVLYLNTAFAAPQIKAVMEREQAKLLVHDEEFSELLADTAEGLPRTLSWVDSESPAYPTLDQLIVANASTELEAPAKPGRQIILTSGTTGTPKGAQRSQPKSLEPIAALLEQIPYKANGTTVIAAPLFHAWGFFNWVLGTSLTQTIVARRRFDPEATLDAIARYRASSLIVVPVMLQRMVELGPEIVGKYDLSSLRVISLSGSALPGELATRAMDLFGDVVYNLYGSTEVATATVATPADLRSAPGTAGRPTRWTRLELLDEHGKPVTPGQVGRIFVGNGLAFDGYTGGGGKEKIDGLMSSGDVGHMDEAGRLFIDGRDDDMIVSGGENVFPREIEDLLADHAGIEEASVIGVEDPQWGQRLKSFVVLRDGHALDEDEVKQYVKANLAGYKVPREVVFLDRLPRNATGKVLKRELKTQ